MKGTSSGAYKTTTRIGALARQSPRGGLEGERGFLPSSALLPSPPLPFLLSFQVKHGIINLEKKKNALQLRKRYIIA